MFTDHFRSWIICVSDRLYRSTLFQSMLSMQTYFAFPMRTIGQSFKSKQTLRLLHFFKRPILTFLCKTRMPLNSLFASKQTIIREICALFFRNLSSARGLAFWSKCRLVLFRKLSLVDASLLTSAHLNGANIRSELRDLFLTSRPIWPTDGIHITPHSWKKRAEASVI